jgi:hypothetical protein
MELGQVYAQALKLALAGKAEVHHYANALPTLWSNGLPATSPIVIVWDRKSLGKSSDDRLLEKHLTPLDWALAWSLKQADAKQPIPSIVIIDATAGNWKDTWAWSVRHQLLADMPWVTLSAPIVREDDKPLYKWTFSKAAMDNGGVDEDGVIRKNDRDAWELCLNSGTDKPDPAPLERLNKLWIASLRLSDEHHDVNNIITPLMLLQSPEILDSPTEKVMLRRLQWTGMRAPEPAMAANEDLPAGNGVEKGKGRITRLVVLDDRVSRWWPVLANILEIRYGGLPPIGAGLQDHNAFERVTLEDGPFEIWTATELNILVKQLESLSPLKGLENKLHFTPGAEQQGVEEILLLDLDLGPSSLSLHYEWIIRVAKLLDDGGRSIHLFGRRLIPEGGTDAALLRATRGTPEWRELLTLPARVLATIDPTLPIILFASTTKRDVIEVLRPFYNIVTGFDKPQLFGAGDIDALESAKTRLYEAITRASQILAVRRTLIALGKPDGPGDFLTDKMKDAINLIGSEDPIVVDVFVDESGSPYEQDRRFKVGALVLLKKYTDIKNYHYPFSDDLVKHLNSSNIKWKEQSESNSLVPVENCEGCKPKNGGGSKSEHRGDLHLKHLFRESIDVKNLLDDMFFSINLLECAENDIDIVKSGLAIANEAPIADFVYRAALTALLEYVAIHQVLLTIRSMRKTGQLYFRIHLANLTYPKNKIDKGTFHSEKWTWGIDQVGHGLPYMNNRDGRFFVAEIFGKYDLEKIAISRFRSFKLDVDNLEVEAPHYLIDVLVGRSSGVPIAVSGAYSKTVEQVFSSAEAGANRQIGLCLARYYKVKDSETFGPLHICSRLRGCISGYVAQATGADLAEAARLIAASAG